MDVERIEQLIEVLEGSRTEELSVQSGDCTVLIRKSGRPKPANVKALAPVGVQERPASVEETAEGHFILAPMVGVFHKADGTVKAGTEVAGRL